MYVFDTMTMAKEVVKAKGKTNRIKNPTLEESIKFFDIELEDNTFHNALVDVKGTLEVFKKLVNIDRDHLN